MAVRVTATEVKMIIDTDLTDLVVDAFILGANVTVTEVLGSDTNLTTAHKKEIERWLAAHLIAATREQQIQKAGAAGASITYQGRTGMGLNSTLYGQQVLALDTTGKMAGAMSKQRASISAVESFD